METIAYRRVEDVERVHSRLQFAALRDMKFPSSRQIHLRGSKTPQHVSSKCALSALSKWCRPVECRRIKSPAARRVRIVEIQQLSWNQIGTGHGRKSQPESVSAADDIYRSAGDCANSGVPPIIREECARKGTGAPEGNRVTRSRIKAVPHVKGGGPTIGIWRVTRRGRLKIDLRLL